MEFCFRTFPKFKYWYVLFYLGWQRHQRITAGVKGRTVRQRVNCCFAITKLGNSRQDIHPDVVQQGLMHSGEEVLCQRPISTKRRVCCMLICEYVKVTGHLLRGKTSFKKNSDCFMETSNGNRLLFYCANFWTRPFNMLPSCTPSLWCTS